MEDTPYDAAMTRSKQELARQLVDANVMIEKWEKEAEHATCLIDALKARIEQLEAALRSISNKCPATCDITLAHEMAEEAEAALAPEQDSA